MNAERNPVYKTLNALTWLIQQPDEHIGVRQMAAALEVAPSTAHRIFTALSKNGFVQKEPVSGRYMLGLELFRLAQLALARVPLRDVARRHMRKLSTACNETVLLSLYDEGRQEMIFAESIESTSALRYVIALNTWLPVYSGASGMAIMAYLPDDTRRAIMTRFGLKAVTTHTITEPYRLEHELEAIRARGYAITRGQRIPGAIGLAAPIMAPNGVVGALCLTIPEARFESNSEARLAALLTQAADEITAEIGADPQTRINAACEPRG